MLYKNNRVKIAIETITETIEEVNGQVVFQGKALNPKMKSKVYTFYFSSNKQQLKEILNDSNELLIEGYLTDKPKLPKDTIQIEGGNPLFVKLEEMESCHQNQSNLNKFDYTFTLRGFKPSGTDFIELEHESIISSLSDKELRIVCHNTIFAKAFREPQIGSIYNVKTFMLADRNGNKSPQDRDSFLVQTATLLPPIMTSQIS
ncbi:MAG: hypothetical protein ABS904_00325 [Solibacillus isronensis]